MERETDVGGNSESHKKSSCVFLLQGLQTGNTNLGRTRKLLFPYKISYQIIFLLSIDDENLAKRWGHINDIYNYLTYF